MLKYEWIAPNDMERHEVIAVTSSLDMAGLALFLDNVDYWYELRIVDNPGPVRLAQWRVNLSGLVGQAIYSSPIICREFTATAPLVGWEFAMNCPSNYVDPQFSGPAYELAIDDGSKYGTKFAHCSFSGVVGGRDKYQSSWFKVSNDQ